jgi:hypothetical protein
MKKFEEVISTAKKSVESELKTNKGTKKESIYNEIIFMSLNDKEKKSARKKIRNFVISIFESIIFADKEKNKESVSKLANSFSDFYKETYKVNDFSFSSIASENTNTKNKETIINALTIIKRELKIK